MASADSRSTRPGRATAADVAAASGVSRATVSYVLNATPGQTIPEPTRRRVLQAASDLGYVPSVHARALASGSTGIVVIDSSTIPHGELIASTTRTLSRALVDRGYVPVVNQHTGSDSADDVLVTLAQRLQPVVVVALGGLSAEVVRRLREAGVGRVVAPEQDGGAAHRRIADPAAAQIDYLARRGHTRVAYAAPSEPELAALSELRLHGARGAARAHGVELVPIALTAQEEVASLLRRACADGVTAVAAYNDDVAVGVLGAAQRAGIAVPEELAVMGVDDLPVARRTHPQLTSVSQSDGAAPRVDPADVEDVLSGARPLLTTSPPRVVVRASA
ncbi:LacI family DNA-binding transcriptional regulator [Microbacterium betulae]|uniref:LacI family DNA-binding transcriptional regulator n=1 Tax=Microbacterium betulae TaxID=2981139 RepID=A0AA97FH57_9MICO|nr:LacI family DNA-binding transcriptional regulator [Microbacterium sp. AB]WOF23336.1 LacI family DNA-binding transcriptional regulator [Microbacterium sp. AB]